MKKRMSRMLTLAAGAAWIVTGALADTDSAGYVTVSDVQLRPQESQKVVVNYTLQGRPAFVRLDILTNNVSIGMEKIRTLSGDVSLSVTNLVEPSDQVHTIVWDASADWPKNFSTQAQARVYALYTNHLTDVYLVVDLSGGTNAAHYPVGYSFTAPNPAQDPSCCLTKLWLKYVNGGTFMMGSPETEPHRTTAMETQHSVTLTKPFFAGVFEVTRGQYLLVTGKTPSAAQISSASVDSGVFPVSNIAWQDIRGTSTAANTWPSSHEVDASSFMGILRAKTGLADFDLPTSAQWEYTCRAGTTTAWNNGTTNTVDNDTDANLDLLGWYSVNSPVNGVECVHPVGQKLPNAWGIYDMHGNLFEFCLDWLNQSGTPAGGEDPAGDASGTYRVLRGGCYQSLGGYFKVSSCRSAYASGQTPGSGNGPYQGFRVFRNLE